MEGSNETAKIKYEKKILILEDDPTFRPIWNYIFTKLDMPILYDWSSRESEAEKYLLRSTSDQDEYDLFISDIFLPGMVTGLDFWHKHEKVLRYKTIIVSSLEPRKVDRFLGNREYYPFYLRKPLNISECAETITWIFKHQ